MKASLEIDQELIATASRLTGVTDVSCLVKMGLEALVSRHEGIRLASLGGTEPQCRAGRRRRSEPTA
ncbi:MAG TPA: type II toxin-antitoxin system VapB family antitoxin [Candidatus Krumholzibacteria bacterium]|nr:type II toxin-antitoxin system VapB family antitoxin [Candidatus Krumholzibacteria bacterium]HRX52331.1 type II toxin-antitoxin system VapB family antitoxin [Candidatus Krumholzibacteria bacterium]